LWNRNSDSKKKKRTHVFKVESNQIKGLGHLGVWGLGVWGLGIRFLGFRVIVFRIESCCGIQGRLFMW